MQLNSKLSIYSKKSPWEIVDLVVGQKAHHQQAVLQLGQFQKAECHCICGTCSEGLLP